VPAAEPVSGSGSGSWSDAEVLRNGRDIGVQVPFRLGHGIAAELLDHGFGEDEGDHRLGDDAGGRTAHTSERWWLAFAASPVLTSTVDRARGTVAMGFIPARTRSGPPVDIPPSVPPARLLVRRNPSGPTSSSSWALDPGRFAVWKPSPTSTPLMAWMPMRAPASRESSRRSQCTWEPSPGGSP